MFYDSPTMLKQNLLRTISNMQEVSQLFVKQPEKDFSRKRKYFFCRHDPFSFVYEWKHGSKRMDGLLGFLS